MVSGTVALLTVFIVFASTVIKLLVFVAPFNTEKTNMPSSSAAFGLLLGTKVGSLKTSDKKIKRVDSYMYSYILQHQLTKDRVPSQVPGLF